MNTKRKYLAFDIETATSTEDESDWHPADLSGSPVRQPSWATAPNCDFGTAGRPQIPGDRMTREEATALVRYLEDQTKRGYTLLTWNGLGFDLDILAEEAQMLPQCRALAVAHVDMMFHIFCQLGHGVGLDAAAKGMGLAGKTKGMSGELAPVLWAQGKREEVLRYVAQDVRTTLELATACEALGELRWVARAERCVQWHCPKDG